MEHIAAILLIVGCGGGMEECRELPAPVPAFELYEDCERARQPALAGLRAEALNVFATCIEVDPALMETDAELVWDISDENELVAAIEPSQELPDQYIVASGSGDEESVKQ